MLKKLPTVEKVEILMVMENKVCGPSLRRGTREAEEKLGQPSMLEEKT